MTREELKVHCEKEIEMCEFWAIGKGEKPSGKIYEEHKLILELLEHESVIDKIKAKIEQSRYGLVNDGLDLALNIIDECVAESEE